MFLQSSVGTDILQRNSTVLFWGRGFWRSWKNPTSGFIQENKNKKLLNANASILLRTNKGLWNHNSWPLVSVCASHHTPVTVAPPVECSSVPSHSLWLMVCYSLLIKKKPFCLFVAPSSVRLCLSGVKFKPNLKKNLILEQNVKTFSAVTRLKS